MIRRVIADILVIALAAGLAGFGGGMLWESHQHPVVSKWA